MPHAIQIRQTGGPEVLNWTPIGVGEPGSGQVRLRMPLTPTRHWKRAQPRVPPS
jgi:hypothetical protein